MFPLRRRAAERELLHSNVSLSAFAETFAASISEHTWSTVRVEAAVFARSYLPRSPLDRGPIG